MTVAKGSLWRVSDPVHGQIVAPDFRGNERRFEVPSEHAERIVLCVNAHDELLEVLQHFMPFIESERDDERNTPWVERARAVIAKATGGAE